MSPDFAIANGVQARVMRHTGHDERSRSTAGAWMTSVERARAELDRWLVVHPGPATGRWTWSGIPCSLTEALRPTVDAERVSADLPSRGETLGRAVMTAFGRDGASSGAAAPLVWARDMRLRHLQPVREADVMITMGSVYGSRLGRWRPSMHATFDDCTVAQSAIAPSRARTRWQERQRRLYESANVCLAASTWTADSIEHDYGIPRRKIYVTGLGANISCAQTEKNWSEPRILWVGVDWERKGGDLLLEAFVRAGIPGATLDLVGQHPAISQANVRCHGLVRDGARLRLFYERATLFVLPSRFEAFGMVLIEAASAGTPCLGSDVGGIPDAIGPAGMTVPAGDVDALTEGLIAMTDPSVAARHVAPALAHAEAHSWSAVAQRVIDAVCGGVAASRST